MCSSTQDVCCLYHYPELLQPNLTVQGTMPHLPQAMNQHTYPIYATPHVHFPQCEVATSRPACSVQQYTLCNVLPQPSCNIPQQQYSAVVHGIAPIMHQQPVQAAMAHPHTPYNMTMPLPQPHFLPAQQPHSQASHHHHHHHAHIDDDIQIIADHRPRHPYHQHHIPRPPMSRGAGLARSPPLHLRQGDPLRHDPQPPYPPASYSRLRRGASRRMSMRRLMRSIAVPPPPVTTLPPPPVAYPGFILHLLTMMSNHSPPPYGMEIRDENGDVENYEALLNLAERLGEAKPRGLLKADIEQLPSYRYNVSSHQSDQMSCVVCMCEFEQRQLLRVLPCNHEFHAKCVDKWLKTNRTCPICRADTGLYLTASG